MALTAAAISIAYVQSYAQDRARPNMTLFCPVDHDQLADLLKKSVKSSGGLSNVRE